jgi:TetR/AcrR family transcriptional repressor of bet genes
LSANVTEKNFASRNRKSQRAFRKRQLIDATIDCIDKLGISQTTLARIAERAGISQGNVVFYFHSKDELLEQTLHYLNDEYTSNWQTALDDAGPDPLSQLQALIEASFAPQVFNRKKISVWYAFWGESRSRPKYMRICGASDRAFSETISKLCQAIAARDGSSLSPRTAAYSIEGMIDGMWQNFLLGPTGFKRAHAISTIFELLGSIFPQRRQIGP